jgi:hypothetical protein
VFSCSWVPRLNTGKDLGSLGVLFSSDISSAPFFKLSLDLSGHCCPIFVCLDGCLNLFLCYFVAPYRWEAGCALLKLFRAWTDDI